MDLEARWRLLLQADTAEARRMKETIREIREETDRLEETTTKQTRASKAGTAATIEFARGLEDFATSGVRGAINNLNQMAYVMGATGPWMIAITGASIAIDAVARNWDSVLEYFGQSPEKIKTIEEAMIGVSKSAKEMGNDVEAEAKRINDAWDKLSQHPQAVEGRRQKAAADAIGAAGADSLLQAMIRGDVAAGDRPAIRPEDAKRLEEFDRIIENLDRRIIDAKSRGMTDRDAERDRASVMAGRADFANFAEANRDMGTFEAERRAMIVRAQQGDAGALGEVIRRAGRGGMDVSGLAANTPAAFAASEDAERDWNEFQAGFAQGIDDRRRAIRQRDERRRDSRALARDTDRAMGELGRDFKRDQDEIAQGERVVGRAMQADAMDAARRGQDAAGRAGDDLVARYQRALLVGGGGVEQDFERRLALRQELERRGITGQEAVSAGATIRGEAEQRNAKAINDLVGAGNDVQTATLRLAQELADQIAALAVKHNTNRNLLGDAMRRAQRSRQAVMGDAGTMSGHVGGGGVGWP